MSAVPKRSSKDERVLVLLPFQLSADAKMPGFQALIAGSDLMIVGENPDQLVINACWCKDFSFIL